MSQLTYNARDFRLRGRGWMQAHRRAVLAGEFIDPCDHNRELYECGRLGCREDYDTIVTAYLHGKKRIRPGVLA